MTKNAFLISGFTLNRTAADGIFKDLRQAIAAKGYEVVPVPITWNYKTVPQYVDKFIDFYNQNKADENIIIGGSYGAMVAFLAAPKVEPDIIMLCSLSPYFKEDKDKTTQEYRLKKFGKKRSATVDLLSAKRTADEINQIGTKVIILYGELEKEVFPRVVNRAKSTAKDITNARLIEVPNAPHPFRDPAYIKGIKQALTK